MCEAQQELEGERELVILHGPPFSGKTRYCHDKLPNHAVVALNSPLFADKSLHSVCKQISKTLLAGKDVVVDDCNALQRTRASYIKHAKAELGDRVKVNCVVLQPVGGIDQCRWAYTQNRVKTVLTNHSGSKTEHNRNSIISPDTWREWAATLLPGASTNQPRIEEGYNDLVYKKARMHLARQHLPHKALFIPAEAIYELKKEPSDDNVHTIKDTFPDCATVIKQWLHADKMRKVFVLLDEHALFPASLALMAEDPDAQIACILQCRFVVYHALRRLGTDFDLYFITCEYGSAGVDAFFRPPKPGMIAMLQMAFGIDLRESLCVVPPGNDTSLALAEACGVPHCPSQAFFSDSGWTVESMLRKHVVQPKQTPKYIETLELSGAPWENNVDEILKEKGEKLEGCLGVYNMTIQFGHVLGMVCVSPPASASEEDVREDPDLFDTPENVPSPRKLPQWMTAIQENKKRSRAGDESETSRPQKRAKQDKDD